MSQKYKITLILNTFIFILLFQLYYTFCKAQVLSQTELNTQTSSYTTSTTQIIENNFPKDIIFTRAMWYGKAFHGKKMANGQKFDMYNPTLVAHRTLALGTKIKIINLKNGISIDAVVSDRGPYSKNKKTKEYIAGIDVSYAAAKILEFDKAGIADVKIKVY